MGALFLGLLVLVGVFVWNPAEKLARSTRARKLKVEVNKVSDDDVFGLTLFYAVIIYFVGWWFLEVTGLLALISAEF
jgi:hypothetical protein